MTKHNPHELDEWLSSPVIVEVECTDLAAADRLRFALYRRRKAAGFAGAFISQRGRHISVGRAGSRPDGIVRARLAPAETSKEGG